MNKITLTSILSLALLMATLPSSPKASAVLDHNGNLVLTPAQTEAGLFRGQCMAYKISNKVSPLPHIKCRFS